MAQEQVYKAMLKSELARYAGVSLKTLNQWINQDNINIPKHYKLLPPYIVKHLCEKYVIILDE